MDLIGPDHTHVDGKKCSKCGSFKERPEFIRDKRSADGLASWCKKCNSEKNKKWAARVSKQFDIIPKVKPQFKTCGKCKSEKPQDRFGQHKTSKDGLQSWCKDCINGYSRQNYKWTGYVRPDYSKYEDGMTIQEFAVAAGCSYSHAAKYGKDNGLKFDTERGRIVREKIARYKEYGNSGMSYGEVARLEGLAQSNISSFCHKYKIKLKDGRKK